MFHPKMQYTYVGVDSHKDTHTAVFLDCFFEKLGEITFNNLPSEFVHFLSIAQNLLVEGTVFLFGLEDISSYGRTLAIFLKANGQEVKHVNAYLVAAERKAQPIIQKTDSVDAECAARVLLSKFNSLPNADTQDIYRVMQLLVARRNFLVKNKASAKNQLHNFITQHYPNYRKFFDNISGKTALSFFSRYPSPSTLKGTTAPELTEFLNETGRNYYTLEKAQEILNTLEDTTMQEQEFINRLVQSNVRQLRFNIEEIEKLDEAMETFLKKFNCTLTSMEGIDTVTAARMLAYIGDIKNFPTPAKLARYAGIAPNTYASGKKDIQYSNQRGNRKLNSLFYHLSVRVCFPNGTTQKVKNSFFHNYYNRKISEGKTKSQALKCAQRRLVNIIWSMLTNNEDYINPPAYYLSEADETNETTTAQV